MRILLASLLVCLATATAAAGQESEASKILGRSSAHHLSFEAVEERVDLAAGSRLRLQPDLEAPLLEILARDVSVVVLDRSADWVRVRVGSWQGWVLTTGADLAELTFIGLAERAPAVRLEFVRGLLGDRVLEDSLGPYRLLTDISSQDVLARLGLVVANLEQAFRERFAMDPGPPGDEVIILFATEADYRRLEAESPSLRGLETEGHTTQVVLETTGGVSVSTMVATFLGDRSPEDLEGVLIHELVHLLCRRSSSTRIPPWLEEGMAEDLALSQVDSQGHLDLGSWGGSSSVRSYFLAGGSGGIINSRSGSREALFSVLATWHEPTRTELETLVQLPWTALVDPAQRSALYAQSAMLVRFLLDGPDPDTRHGFLRHLSKLEDGSARLDLWQAIEQSPEEFDENLYLWLRQRAGGFGMRIP